MQSSPAYRDTSYISLGERRGKSDLARFSLDLSWARAVSDSARSRAYPSPPMSGSPPLPPRRNLDSSDRGHVSYGSSGQDVYPGTQTPQSDISESRGPPMRAYQPDIHPPMTYSPYRMEDMQQTPPVQYQHRGPIPPQMMPQQPAYRQHPPAPFSTPDRPPTGETPDYSASPKAQRKTKGHVASACVPCKRAHLRCDAQRPCSRCLANGKEDACVDVQHKKRGRPRLRDEREQRYESLGPGYPHSQHEGSMNRPLSLYSPESSVPPGYGDSLHRSSSYRVLKSQGPLAPRYPEHGQPLDPNMFGGPMPPGQRMLPSQEPLCAYLTMEMEISKSTRSFSDTVGLQNLVSRRLQDLVGNSDREKIARLQRVLEEERREREPTYLPPIFLKFEEARIIQSVGFGQDEIGQLQLGHQEVITIGSEGQQRTFQARFGLAKKESTYFIAAVFQVPAPPQPYHQPSSLSYSREPYAREPQYGYQQAQHSFPPNQGPPPFVSNPGYGDPRGDSMNYRAPVSVAPNIPISASMPSYSQPPQTRPDYSSQTQNPYQTPRSELPQAQPQRQHDLQLPPIRDQRNEGPSAALGRRRDDRRFDIGGLLEQPHTSGGR